MSPFEHGETFVLDDGGETDLDLGNYERFLDVTLTSKHNITTGKVYQDVIQRERRGDYLGKTVQIVPHVTNRIIEWIKEAAHIPIRHGDEAESRLADVCLVEVGGTVGDIESMVFLEALRQLQFIEGKQNMLFIHVGLVPSVGGSGGGDVDDADDDEEAQERAREIASGEQKTKPTQHSVKALTSVGIFPDIVVCRCTTPLTESTKHKLSIFCQVPANHVISVHNVSNIYHVPQMLLDQQIHHLIQKLLFPSHTIASPELVAWQEMANRLDHLSHQMKIAIVGKYTGVVGDTYLSVLKSITHSGVLLDVDVKVIWINSSDLETETLTNSPKKYNAAWKLLRDDDIQGIIIPGGFGVRGIEGKILAANFARVNNKPCLGLCLGMQVMCIEYCRNVLGLLDANSVEFNASTNNPVVIYMPETAATGQLSCDIPDSTKGSSSSNMGGTMRLGSRATYVSRILLNDEPSLAWELYECDKKEQTHPNVVVVNERYRHRYEVNPSFIHSIESKGLYFSGRGFAEGDDNLVTSSEQENCTLSVTSRRPQYQNLCRMEIVELPRSVHPYYIGGQYHPEYKSRPNRPAPLFWGFIKASLHRQQQERIKRSVFEDVTGKRPTTAVNSSGNSDNNASPNKRLLVRSMSITSESVRGVCSPIAAWQDRQENAASEN